MVASEIVGCDDVMIVILFPLPILRVKRGPVFDMTPSKQATTHNSNFVHVCLIINIILGKQTTFVLSISYLAIIQQD